ncbi:MAG: glycosyltransferase family 2 protein [Phycisphaerae bacterium]
MPADTHTCVGAVDVSIVIPLRNEQENVEPLYRELTDAMRGGRYSYEVLFVDDGSRDDTLANLERVTSGDPTCTVVELARNFGQTAALAAGFELARGRYIVAMDGDLQNDPADIPGLLDQLNEPPGYDVVSGWRKNRRDKLWSRRLPSVLANRLIRWVTNVHIKDLGCTLKAYRREVLEDVNLYGEMHRFLPIITRWRGARIAERPVNHRPRIHGRTKYGLRRTVKVLLDLITVKFLGDYLTKPIYFFGKLSLVNLAGAFGVLGVAICQKFGILTSQPLNLNRNVLVLLAVMLGLMAVLFVVMGVLSELLVRIYHESQGRKVYKVRRLIRGGSTP